MIVLCEFGQAQSAYNQEQPVPGGASSTKEEGSAPSGKGSGGPRRIKRTNKVRELGSPGDIPPPARRIQRKEAIMFSWAVTFLIIALVAAVLGFSGIAGTAVNIAWILFVVGLIAAVIFFVLGRRSPPL
jgi:uncharacterized membrane protein YtjA (UPF0391 family)